MDTEPVTITEHGAETHGSWLVLNASKVQSGHGQRLFDSEIGHQHYVIVTIRSCSRQRNLNHDWTMGDKVLVEMAMSLAQWGAFVSSFGDGGGVPATLFRNHAGPVAQAPAESRLEESMQDVHDSGERALSKISESYDELLAAFERGAGKREMKELMFSLKCQINNGPKGMEFAAKSLTEHVENVVTKGRADIEAMAAAVGVDTVTVLEGNTQTPQIERSVRQRPTRKRGM